MDISLLREFITLSECLNYTKAAEQLHLTQPTLSKHIVSMEHELGCSLLVRDRRSVELTTEGQMFAATALQIVETFDECQKRISEFAKQQPLIVGGVLYDPAIASIISITSALLDGDGNNSVTYTHSVGESDVITQLLHDEIDIALAYATSENIEEMGLERMPLSRTRFVALVNNANPLAKRKEASIDDLRNMSFIKFADNYSIVGWNRIEKVCKDHGYNPRTHVVLGRDTSNYVSTPLGPEDVSILPNNLGQLRYLSDFAQMSVVPLVDEDAVFRLFAIYKKERKDQIQFLLDAYSQARKIIINHGKSGSFVESD